MDIEGYARQILSRRPLPWNRKVWWLAWDYLFLKESERNLDHIIELYEKEIEELKQKLKYSEYHVKVRGQVADYQKRKIADLKKEVEELKEQLAQYSAPLEVADVST